MEKKTGKDEKKKKAKIIVCPCIYENLEESKVYLFSLNDFNFACNYHKPNNEDVHKYYLVSVCKECLLLMLKFHFVVPATNLSALRLDTCIH